MDGAPGRLTTRIPGFSPVRYRYRSLIEHFLNKINRFRAIARRFEKIPAKDLVIITLDTVRIWLRAHEALS